MTATKEMVITRLARTWSKACDLFEEARAVAIAAGENDLKALAGLNAAATRLDRAERALRKAMTAYDAEAA